MTLAEIPVETPRWGVFPFMRNIKLTIEFDGTSYAGWQIQLNGLAIQQVMEESLARLVGHQVRLHGSGRTDAGVHARGMVATFATDRPLPLRAFSDGLNSLLPPEIAVLDAQEVPDDFHPRFDAKGKHYRYTIFNGKRRAPLLRHTAWFVRGGLDLAAMRRAAIHLVGEHDFTAFRAANCAAKTSVRTVWSVDISRDGELVLIDVKGRGFLKNMVRIMAGTLVEVAQGKMSPDIIPRLLDAADRSLAGRTAPPHGLCLIEVYY